MKCPKCGKLLQSIFAGISSDFKNVTEIKNADGKVVASLVCNNPDCPDGQLNCGMTKVEDLPF